MGLSQFQQVAGCDKRLAAKFFWFMPMSGYDFTRPFTDSETFPIFRALDSETASSYGATVKAFELSNAEYNQRYQRLANANRMKSPPMHDRKFAGYVVVRRLGTKSQYETWMPDMIFCELYEPVSGDSSR
jgi:hypothetical protein